MKSISEIPSLSDESVLVRVDYNVPIEGGIIADTKRIVASYETIDYILSHGGRPIIVAHLGDGAQTLAPVASFLKERYTVEFFSEDILTSDIKAHIESVRTGTVILLENIRRYPGETKNEPRFTEALANLGVYYVNDAFSVSHRTHASIVGLPKLLPAYAGNQMIEEIARLNRVFQAHTHPFVLILGGAKFATKIPLLSRLNEVVDTIIIVGAILNDFYKVASLEVGASVVEEGYDTEIREMLKSDKLILPTDVIVMRSGETHTATVTEIQKSDVIVDIGPESIAYIKEKIATAKLIVWNGPTGWYEKGFVDGTIGLAEAVLASLAESVIGGGDTGAVIENLMKNNDKDGNVFISTGGGAMLDYLAHGTLPGIDALS